MECEKNCHLVTNLSESPLPLHIPPISIQGLGQVDCLEYNQDEKEREGEPMSGGGGMRGQQTKQKRPLLPVTYHVAILASHSLII